MTNVVVDPKQGSLTERSIGQTILHRDSKGDMAKRVADRLKPSNNIPEADTHVVHGTGPTRAHTTIHRSGGSGTRHGGEGR